MILKILTRTSPGAIQSLLKYVQNHDKSNDGKVHLLLKNVRSRDIKGQTREFLQNEAYRKILKRGSIFARHEILSFSPESQKFLTVEKLEDIGKKYIELRGQKALMVGSLHTQGREHHHIHFVTSGVELMTGKSTDIPKKELYRIKAELQAYYVSKYPELGRSAVRHGLGKEYLSQKEYQLKLRTNRKLKKEEIAQTVKTLYAQSKTQNEFLEKLQEAGIPHYERKGVPQGIVFEDLKFRFSRLEVSVQDLPLDRTQEEKALDEIRKLRQKLQQRNRGRELER